MEKSTQSTGGAAAAYANKAQESNRFWDDEKFQDGLTRLLVYGSQEVVERCAGLLSPEDFRQQKGAKNARARWMVAERALEYFEKHKEPLGELARADVLQYADQLSLGSTQVNEIKEYLKDLANLKPIPQDAIVEKVVIFKNQLLKTSVLDEMIDLQAAGHLTDEKWDELFTKGRATAQEAPACGGALVTVCADAVAIEPVSWLWPDRIARGKLNIIAGDPGLAKSTITISMAAVVTGKAGRFGVRLWPDGARCKVNGSVVFLSAEDDAEDTLCPRLKAAGADLSRVHIVQSVLTGYTGKGEPAEKLFSLQKDLHQLDKKLEELGDVVLLVIDPITAYLDGIDSNKNSDVRGTLAPLKTLAYKHNVAVIEISHVNKDGARALTSVNGSLAFVAAARTAYLVVEDALDPLHQRRLVLSIKNNLGPPASGLAYTVESAKVSYPGGSMETARIVWDDASVAISAQEALTLARGNSPAEELGPKEQQVVELLGKEADLKPAEIADKLDWKDVNTRNVLQRLRGKGKVKSHHGSYRLADPA